MFLTGHGIKARTHTCEKIARFPTQCIIRTWKTLGLPPHASQFLMMHLIGKCGISAWPWVFAISLRWETLLKQLEGTVQKHSVVAYVSLAKAKMSITFCAPVQYCGLRSGFIQTENSFISGQLSVERCNPKILVSYVIVEYFGSSTQENYTLSVRQGMRSSMLASTNLGWLTPRLHIKQYLEWFSLHSQTK